LKSEKNQLEILIVCDPLVSEGPNPTRPYELIALSERRMTMINVDLTIQGMIALFFEVNTGKVVACQAGVLKDAPGHKFELKIVRKGTPPHPIPTGPIDKKLKLVVSPNPSITFATGKINRHDGSGAPKSFDWVLDFEREVYTSPIGSSEMGFQSILHINSGQFSTLQKSANKLIFFDEKVGNCQNVGIVATVVGLQIELAQGQSSKFFNGSSELFTATPTDEFKVDLLNDRPHDHASASQHHGDANFFYSAVGQKIKPGEKKVFSSTTFSAGVGPATPEASCLVPRGGQGPIGQP